MTPFRRSDEGLFAVWIWVPRGPSDDLVKPFAHDAERRDLGAAGLWPRNLRDKMRVMKSMLGRILRLLVVLALLTPSGALAQQVLYHCHMDARVHQSCCCEDESCPSPSFS